MKNNKCQCIDCKKHLINGHNINSEEVVGLNNEQVRELIKSRNN